MTNEQRARDLVSRWEHGDEKHRQWLRDIATPDITTALAAARRDALEEAARVIEQGQETFNAGSLPEGRSLSPRRSGNLSGLAYAEGIRALIPTPTPEVTTFQDAVRKWLLACFGEEIANDKIERNHRFLEEALELVQACGCTQSEAHQLVDYVFGRPLGEIGQEVGGVMNTLAALCLAHDRDMMVDGETEMRRVWTMVEKIRAKQAAKPKHSPLPEVAAPEPWNPVTSPGHTNLMVSPESIDAFMEANPVPDDTTTAPDGHASDCAIHNAPAYPAGPCDCGLDDKNARP